MDASDGPPGPPPCLTVGDVTLRAWSPDDGPSLLLAVLESLAELRPWMPWAVPTYGPPEAEGFLEHAVASRASGAEYHYAIVDVDGEVAGACGLHPGEAPDGLELGYWVHTPRAGRGLVTRAAAALTDAALALDEVHHVDVRNDRANRRSARVPRRLGFAHVGTRRRSPAAPAETGIEDVWRMTAHAYATSTARAVVHDPSPGH